MPLSFLSGLAVGVVIGLAIDSDQSGQSERGVDHPSGIEPRLQSKVKPSAPSEKDRPQPDDVEASSSDVLGLLLKANAAGCDCPLPPPEGIDRRYLEDGVQDWLSDLTERCPQFGQRDVELDCSEYPCILMVESLDSDADMVFDRERNQHILCRENGSLPSEPIVYFRGDLGNDDQTWYVMVLRPDEGVNYRNREMARYAELFDRFIDPIE